MKKNKIVKSKEEIVREGISKFNLESELFESLLKKFGTELLLIAFNYGLLSESLRILKEGGLKQGDKKFGHQEFYHYLKIEEVYDFLKFKEYLICYFITNASVNVLVDDSASFVEKHNARMLGSIACIIYEEIYSESQIDFIDENKYEDEYEDENVSISFNIFEL